MEASSRLRNKGICVTFLANIKMILTSHSIGTKPASNGANAQLGVAASHRHRSLRILFIHRDADIVDSCVKELTKAHFTASAEVVLTLAQCAAQLHSQAYDAIVVEYPSPNWKGPQALQLLRQTAQDTPLIFVTTPLTAKYIEELATHDAFDYVESNHIVQLPMVVRRALNERELRAELQQAEKALRNSQSLYRALVENPSYGICSCDAQEKFLGVNQALAAMLGYENKEELLAANLASEFVLDLDRQLPFIAKEGLESHPIEPVEIEWKRKNGTTLKARISGRAIFNEHGLFSGYEIIAVDITEQRALEDHLRRLALSDSLTGLANHRRLFEVLHAEICRTKRTNREFSLVLLDLDGLKRINDRLGHLAGNRALCRLSQILTDCCRSIDTAARQGGDEFALVLPETGAAAAALVARRVCDLLAADTEEPALSVSVGVASYPQDAADSIGTLLYAADRALYAMKSKKLRLVRASQSSCSPAKEPNIEFQESQE